MSDTQNLDNSEKIDIILKQAFGFPSTSENKSYYEELYTKFNSYTLSESILLENIPQFPDFDICGTVRNANEIGLQSSDFIDYNDVSSNISLCSIVDDSTGTIRRFKYLKLQQTYNTETSDYGASWFKLDSSNNNILEDSLQYNYKSYYDILNGSALTLPYLYEIYTEQSLQQPFSNLYNLPFGTQGGNWIYNYKNGILFFADFNNLAQQNIRGGIYNINNNNRPVISVYKYIGKKGIYNLTNEINEIKELINNIEISGNFDISNTSLISLINDVSNLTLDISNLTSDFYDLSYNFYNILISPNILNDFSNSNISIIEKLLNDISNINNIINDISYNLINNTLDVSNIKFDISNIKFDVSNIKFDVSNIEFNIESILFDISNINKYLLDLSFNNDSSYNNTILLNKINDISSNLLNTKNEFFAMNSLIKGDIIIANSNINYNHEKILLIENTIYKLDEELHKTFLNISNNINNLENNIHEISNNVIKKNDTIITEIYNNNNYVKSDIIIANSNIDYCEENITLIYEDINNIYIQLNNINKKLNAL